MRKESINMSGVWFKRVTYNEAMKNYYNGNDVLLFPSNVNPVNPWINPYCINIVTDGNSFSNVVNTYAYYNCNSEMGRYVKYYVIDIEKTKENL